MADPLAAADSPAAAIPAAPAPASASPATAEARLPNRLHALAVHDRPQERLDRLGSAALSDLELLAMLLRKGTREIDVLTLAERLLAEAGSLAGLVGWTKADFRRFKGIGPVKALQCVAVMEVARRVVGQQTGESPILGRPELISAFMAPHVSGLAVEKFWVLCLNTRNRLIRLAEITSGTATQTLVHPREVFRVAIREGASRIVGVHNHPSGDPSPSSADIQVTRQLREAGRTTDIDLLDHIIVGRPEHDPARQGFYSFRAGGFL